MTAPQVTSQSSSERSETQFSGASFLSGVGSAFSGAPSSAAKHLAFSIILFFISVTEHHGSASNQVLRETLVDATHRCRASIRTLNGPLLGPVQVGVRSKPRSIPRGMNLGLLGLPSMARSYRPALKTQSPEQGGGCRCLPNLLDRLWFSLHQLRSCPPKPIAWNRAPPFWRVFPSLGRLTLPPLSAPT